MSPLPNGLKLSIDQSALLCRYESPLRSVQECTRLAGLSGGLSLPGASQLITTDTILSLCKSGGQVAGSCLIALAKVSSQRVFFDSATAVSTCQALDRYYYSNFALSQLPTLSMVDLFVSDSVKSLLACLETTTSSSRIKSTKDVEVCFNQKRTPRSVRVNKFYSLVDGSVEITAGQPFLLEMQLFDQWNQKLNRHDDNYLISVSINSNNPQGAVLWGVRSNRTYSGNAKLSRLVISQSGPVELKVFYHEIEASTNRTSLVVLGLFRMNVHEDPSSISLQLCSFIFREGQCISATSSSDWLQSYPKFHAEFIPNYLYRLVSCADTFSAWNITLNTQPGGFSRIEYRRGMESIWTGIGLPSIEMSNMQKLGLCDDIYTGNK